MASGVDQRLLDRDRRGGEDRVAAQRVQPGKVLGGDARGFIREPGEHGRGQRGHAGPINPDRAHMGEAIE